MADKVKRGKKLALQKHEAKQLKQLLFIKATMYAPPIALASDIVTSVTQKVILTIQVVDYQVDECPIKCAQLTQLFTKHGKRKKSTKTLACPLIVSLYLLRSVR